MIHFKDFIPSKTTAGPFSSEPKYQQLEDLCIELSDWTSGNPEFKIINIETVMKPINYGSDGGFKIVEKDKGNTEVITSHQRPFIRVWYKTKKP